MVKVGIVGGTGYTGVELLRLLARHPGVELGAITSRGEAGMAVSDMFPSLRRRVDLKFVTPQDAALEKCVPAKHRNLLEPNRRALQIGIDL